MPWPWAINVSGKGEYFQTSTALSDRAVALKNASRRNFDVGCFQINYRWHGHRFQTIDQMIDPISNTRYAAAFLSRLKAEGGSWDYAIGAYHSRTQHHAARYRKVVAKHRKGISKWVAESRQARPKHSALDNKKEHRQIKQAPPLGGVAQSYPKAARLSVKSAGSLFK
nr:transglycosylase SLT domain-containing protein [Nereida sp. MMG025]